jgi:hypothetical protein
MKMDSTADVIINLTFCKKYGVPHRILKLAPAPTDMSGDSDHSVGE